MSGELGWTRAVLLLSFVGAARFPCFYSGYTFGGGGTQVHTSAFQVVGNLRCDVLR